MRIGLGWVFFLYDMEESHLCDLRKSLRLVGCRLWVWKKGHEDTRVLSYYGSSDPPLFFSCVYVFALGVCVRLFFSL